MTTPVRLADWDSILEDTLHHALVSGVDLVYTRHGDEPSVLYGRCLHRGALLADGHIDGENLICDVHGWDYRVMTGVSAYDNTQRLKKFGAWIEDGGLWIDREEVQTFERENPQPFDRNAYQGTYQDPTGTPAEPHVELIHKMAERGLEGLGEHGTVKAMGVTRDKLPSWDSIQFTTAQLARRPLADHAPVDVSVTIGPRAAKPLRLELPILVSDMSYGALSEEAKVALATGSAMAGTGICSGEGGMLPEAQAANDRYLFELGTGMFGWKPEIATKVQAFHLKFGQAAKTGTGGHLPGSKVQGRIAEVRHMEPGHDAISPSAFTGDLATTEGMLELIAQVRELSGGIPIGAKMSAQRIEEDIDAALELGVDYIILDGRGGGTGAAPLLFRDNISVPTIPALARARRHLDRVGADDVTLVITGGLRMPADFAKALALGADAIAVANSAMQAIGCIAMRACHTNHCPVGIATQDPHLRSRLPVAAAGVRLKRFLQAATELVSVLARACGHERLSDFSIDDLTTFDREMYHLTGIPYGGVNP